MSFQRTVAEHSCAGRPMDQHTAMVGDLDQCFFRNVFAFDFLFSVFVFQQELKAVLLGSSLHCFSVEWRNQGFTFLETHDLRYGIVQKKVVFTVPSC